MLHNERDIVFVTAPYSDTQAPLMAPAILKSIAIKAGKTAATIDLNIQAVNQIKSMTDDIANKFINFFHHGEADKQIQTDLYEMFLSYANQILEYRPGIIGISVFTYNSQVSAKYLSFIIKKLSPNTKVILGGAGLTNNLIGVSHYAEALLHAGLIDFYIRGDGEHALYNYLTTNTTDLPGINTSAWQELTNDDLLKLPIPDYDDYNFDEYSGRRMIPMLGSRGCVRNCSFCDIHAHWTKFTWRSGEHIFAEMQELNQKYQIKSFLFQDSLINGNLKEYRNLMKLISAHNQQHPNNSFDWSSFFILRPEANFTEEDWRLTAEGGGRLLSVGIETLSDTARFHLGKKFTNQDVEFSLRMGRKYNIKFILLFLIGYITETEQDQDAAIQWWRDHEQYRDMLLVNLGTPLGILEGTPLAKQFNTLNLVRVGPTDHDWSNPATNNTPAKRVEWHQRLNKVVTELGFEQYFGADNRFILERMMAEGSHVQ